MVQLAGCNGEALGHYGAKHLPVMQPKDRVESSYWYTRHMAFPSTETMVSVVQTLHGAVYSFTAWGYEVKF